MKALPHIGWLDVAETVVMRGLIGGACGILLFVVGCSPAEEQVAPAKQAEVQRQYSASASLAGDYSSSETLLMQDWKFSHLRLQVPDVEHPVAFVFETTKPILNAKGERQKLIVVATEYSVNDHRVVASAVSSAGGALGFDGQVDNGKLVGALTISPNDPVQGSMEKMH